MAMTARSQGFCADTPPQVAVRVFKPSPPEHLLWARGSQDAGDSLGTENLSQLFQKEVLEASPP